MSDPEVIRKHSSMNDDEYLRTPLRDYPPQWRVAAIWVVLIVSVLLWCAALWRWL